MERIQAMPNRKQQGFTLIEVMVVMAIIGIIVSAVMPLFNSVRSNMQRQEEAASIKQYVTAIKTYYFQKINERETTSISNIQSNLGTPITTLLLPDVSTAANPTAAALLAAKTMVNSGTIDAFTSPNSLANGTSSGTRPIALYVQQPDMSGAVTNYSNYIKNLTPMSLTTPIWGKGYCPFKAMDYYAKNFNSTIIAFPGSMLTKALVISAGRNGVFDTFGGVATAPAEPTTPNWKSQGFVIKGDDQGYVINFSALHEVTKKKDITKTRLNNIASAAGSYFRYKYTTDAFVNNQPINTIINTNMPTYFSSIKTQSGMIINLGLTGSDFVDEFGNPFQVTQLLTTHPYTLLVYSLCGDMVSIPASAP